MRAHGIPTDAMGNGCCRVLIVDPVPPDNIAEVMTETGSYEVRTANNGFEAGVVAQQFVPGVVVLSIGDDPQEALAICRNIREAPALQAARVVAVVRRPADDLVNLLLSHGFDGCLTRPYSPRQLMAELENKTVSLH